MNNGKLRIVGYLAGLAGVLVTSSALAQAADAAPAAAAPAAPPEPAPAAAADASASTSGSAQVGMALPGAAPQAAAVAGSSDHDAVVGRLAVGYLGRNGVTIAGAGINPTVIPTPVIGVRYWLSDMLGIDAGVGFGLTSGSAEQAGMSNDGPSWHLFMIHGGVPIALANAGHFSFQIVPELNLGFAGASQDVGGMESKASGFHLDVGARAGAEIHFGFINVPQLSLQGSVGLRMNMDSTSQTVMDVDSSTSAFSLGTTVGDNPWNIFTSNVAALYYF
ncbi:MAG TPA: hypothetical protein VHP33_38860 [Polyangiaceae bacterium]|nr:hypothetical protein [Polyangiaceae bacterium]